MYIFITVNALTLFLDLGRAKDSSRKSMCHFCPRLWLFDMAPQSGQGKKESVIRAVIQLGFPASKAARCFHISGRTARRWVQNYLCLRILTEKLGVTDGRFHHQNRMPD